MTRRVKLALAVLPLLSFVLAGCVVYEGPYHHPRYGYYSYYR